MSQCRVSRVCWWMLSKLMPIHLHTTLWCLQVYWYTEDKMMPVPMIVTATLQYQLCCMFVRQDCNHNYRPDQSITLTLPVISPIYANEHWKIIEECLFTGSRYKLVLHASQAIAALKHVIARFTNLEGDSPCPISFQSCTLYMCEHLYEFMLLVRPHTHGTHRCDRGAFSHYPQ